MSDPKDKPALTEKEKAEIKADVKKEKPKDVKVEKPNITTVADYYARKAKIEAEAE